MIKKELFAKFSLLSILFMSLILLSACSSKDTIETQKQKELDVISAQQKKEESLLRIKEEQRQIQKAKLDDCFDAAKNKKNETILYWNNYFCGNTDLLDKSCSEKLNKAELTIFADGLKEAVSKEEKDRAECIKIYPQN